MSRPTEQRPLLPFTIQFVRHEDAREWSSEEVIAEIPIRAIDEGVAYQVGEAISYDFPSEYRVHYRIRVKPGEEKP